MNWWIRAAADHNAKYTASCSTTADPKKENTVGFYIKVADELAELLGEEISKLAAAYPNKENTAVLQQLIPIERTQLFYNS